MKIETRKKIILTREEQKVIADLYDFFDKEVDLSMDGVWDIMTDIRCNCSEMASDYGYDIEIIERGE